MKRNRMVPTLCAAAAAVWACFDPTAPPAPCSDYRSCPDDEHCDAVSHLCRPGTIPPPVIGSFTATATRLACGSRTTTLTAVFSGGQGTIDRGVGAVASGSPIPVSLAAPTSQDPTVYTLTVTNSEGRPTTSQVSLFASNVFWPGPDLAAAPTGSEGATATRLRDGRVLIAGGSSNKTAVLLDTGTGQLSPIGTLVVGRENGTATLLGDGRVLLVGGSTDARAEIFSGEWFDAVASLRTPRFFATATLLPTGKVLIAGGGDNARGSPLDSAELFDPGAGRAGDFSPAGTMAAARTGATATLLLDGRVLIAGGVGKDGLPLASAEFYDPSANGGAGAFTTAGSLLEPRSAAAAALLASGLVLFAGGSAYGAAGTRASALGSAEIYDPAGNGAAGVSVRLGATLAVPRSDSSAVLLGNGQVLLVGGRDARDSPIAGAELYDPAGAGASGSFSSPCPPRASRARATATLLPDGRVLIAGGQPAAFASEIFDPAGIGARGAQGAFSPTSFFAPRIRGTATLLRNGQVLLAGGYNGGDFADATATLFQPPSHGVDASTAATPGMLDPREGATATLLADGRVLIAGGYSGHHLDTGAAYLATAEIYAPAGNGPGAFAPTGRLQTERADAAAALLADGRVAIFGGRYTGGVLDTVEIFDPAADGGVGSFSLVASRLLGPRYVSTATLLPNGLVLLAGGRGPEDYPLSTAEIFDPAASSGSGSSRLPTAMPQRLVSERASAAVILLPNGKVLVVGGRGRGPLLSSAELYDPFAGQFIPIAGDQGLRESASSSATLLHDGRVLVAGGLVVSGPPQPRGFLFSLE